MLGVFNTCLIIRKVIAKLKSRYDQTKTAITEIATALSTVNISAGFTELVIVENMK